MNQNIQRALLQSFLIHHCLTQGETRQLLARLKEVESDLNDDNDDDGDSDSLEQYLAAANASLVDLDMELKVTRDQETGLRLYTLVNLQSSATTAPATQLSSTDLMFVRGILDSIFSESNLRANTFYITAQSATVDAYPKDATGRQLLTRTQVVDKLNGLVDGGWLIQHSGGQPWYALSNRALAELGPYMAAKYDSLPVCVACNEIFTLGLVCSTKGCGLRVHKYCLDPYIQINGGETCGECGEGSLTDCREVSF